MKTETRLNTLECLWLARDCARIADRSIDSIFEHTESDVAHVQGWNEKWPDVECGLMHGRADMQENPGTVAWFAAMRNFHITGLCIFSVILGATYPAVKGDMTIDFSDLEPMGWPASWSFNARMTFSFNRTWAEVQEADDQPIIEVMLHEVEPVAQRITSACAVSRAAELGEAT